MTVFLVGAASSTTANSRERSQRHAKWLRLTALAGLLAAFALRLFHLGAESLWYDETVSALLASKPVTELIAHTAGDIHPPGYYLLLHGWQLLAQPSLVHGLEFLLAFPSLWFGMVGVALLFVLGRKLFGAEVGILALWLAAIHPFQIMYSQEVRMYTLASACGLLCLWALLRALDGKRPLPWLGLYVASATVGLYSLYYFAFLWLALNGIALWWLWQTSKPATATNRATWLQSVVRTWACARRNRHQSQENQTGQTRSEPNRFLGWMLAQGAVLLLWLPWLPTFWRQISNPPVPPWRLPWSTAAAFVQSLAEGIAALWVGQTLPAVPAWFWLVATGLLVIATLVADLPARLYAQATPGQKPALRLLRPAGLAVVLLYVWGPFLLLIVLSLVVTPLYHVRYLFPFAAPFLLWIAAALVGLQGRRVWPGAAALVLLVGTAGWSLYHFWFDPHYRADDHRGAVAYLASQWRPGDAILVNAGWVYPALAVYWPVEQNGPFSSLPPPLATTRRLTDVAAENLHEAPAVLQTGSVDGASSLGWGDPQSDFFAMPAAETRAALTRLAGRSERLWHYRLYDTVSDPSGLIRTWLDANTQLLADHPIPGRDFLRLQLYQTSIPNEPGAPPDPASPIFGEALQLLEARIPPEATAGRHLYVRLVWQVLPGLGEQTGDLALSLRLYDSEGALISQEDSGPLPPISEWLSGAVYRTPLALPVPVAARPLTATLALILYERSSGEPLVISSEDGAVSRLSLGAVQINRAAEPVQHIEPFASFDYIDLMAVRPVTLAAPPGATTGIDLVWLPRPNSYTDTYLARLALRDQAGALLDAWEAPLGGWDYPSGIWPPGFAVLDQRQFPLAPTLSPGHYHLTLQVLRASDRRVIPAWQGWLRRAGEEITLASVTVAVPPTGAWRESPHRITEPAPRPARAPLDWSGN